MAICSSKGIDSDMGVTDSNERDAEIKKAFFKSAKKKILALDSSKFDITSFIKICDVSDLDMVVTEKRPSDIWLERFRNAGTEVRYEIATGDQG